MTSSVTLGGCIWPLSDIITQRSDVVGWSGFLPGCLGAGAGLQRTRFLITPVLFGACAHSCLRCGRGDSVTGCPGGTMYHSISLERQ